MNVKATSFALCLFCTLGFILCSFSAIAQNTADELDVQETPSDAKLQTPSRQFTTMEVKLLQELDTRRVKLDRREKTLELREKLADIAEERLGSKTNEMAILKTQLEELLKNLSGKEESELIELAKIYEVMKAESAANVLNRMDSKIVFDIFKRMKRKSTASIMEKMDTGKARIISEMLAEKPSLPELN
jgi:flagellar motility protein MotE (MotC chaperone)